MIDPTITIQGWNSYGKQSEGSLINHGTAILATVAQNAGYEVKILDCRKLHGWEEFDSEIKDFQPTVIGLGFRTADLFTAEKMGIRVKKILPEVILIVGGIHITFALEDILKMEKFNESIDYIVQGEAEITLLEVLRNIESGKSSERIQRGTPPDVNELPNINRDLYDYSAELNHNIWSTITPCVTMLFTRGCNYNCKFCQPCEKILFGHHQRLPRVEKVINELIELREKYNFKYIHFHDDNFIQNRKWVEEFIEKYKSNNFKAKFVIQTRANLVIKFEKYIQQLMNIGLDSVSIGFESGSNRILKFIGKDTTVLQNVKAARICRKYGLKIIANYMYGIPTETKKDMLATKRMIDAIKPDINSSTIFTPMKGTDLFDFCIENGYIPKEMNDNAKLLFTNRYFGNKGIKGIDYRFIFRINLSLIDKTIFKNPILFFIKDHLPVNLQVKIKRIVAKFRNTLQTLPLIGKILKK
jgi:radical SAM superfamily enzyme YgiQ (UPF0313 family)